MDQIFVDSDIALDLLSARKPHYTYAADLFSLSDLGLVNLYVSSLTFANINYILSRQFSSVKARKIILKFNTLVKVLPVNEKIINLALLSDFDDFEDAIQYHAALAANLKILLTRNLKDFKKSRITVLTAQQYLKTLG